MSYVEMLSAVGLIRTSRHRGFCPACRLFQTGDAPREIAAPALIALAFLVVAAVAWAWTIARSGMMDEMAMGLGALGPFVVSWTVMMAAMMLPSAMPLVFEFARNAERRRGWQAATALLGVTYLGMWLAFGVACYGVYVALQMPWPSQGRVDGVAIVLAGLYALTPIKRTSQARCRELCALHGPLPFNLTRSAIVAGVRYGLSCVGCSAGLMIAMVLIGMSNLLGAVLLAGVVLVYKLAPPLAWRSEIVLSLGVAAAGVAYAVLA